MSTRYFKGTGWVSSGGDCSVMYRGVDYWLNRVKEQKGNNDALKSIGQEMIELSFNMMFTSDMDGEAHSVDGRLMRLNQYLTETIKDNTSFEEYCTAASCLDSSYKVRASVIIKKNSKKISEIHERINTAVDSLDKCIEDNDTASIKKIINYLDIESRNLLVRKNDMDNISNYPKPSSYKYDKVYKQLKRANERIIELRLKASKASRSDEMWR